MERGCAGPHGTRKPLQIAVGGFPGTKATPGAFNRAIGGVGRIQRVLTAPHGLPLVTHQPLHSASYGAASIYPRCLAGLGWLPVVSSLAFVVVSHLLAGHWAGGSLTDGW